MDFTEADFCEVFQKIDTPLSQIYWRPPVYEFIPLIEKYRMITFLFGKSSSLEIFCWRISALISASPWGGDFSSYKIGNQRCIRSLYDIKIWSYVKYHRYWFQYSLDFVFNWFHCLVDFYVCLLDLRTLKPLSCK